MELSYKTAMQAQASVPGYGTSTFGKFQPEQSKIAGVQEVATASPPPPPLGAIWQLQSHNANGRRGDHAKGACQRGKRISSLNYQEAN